MQLLRGKPSPAMVVAVCALAFAMVGTAVAGTDGLNEKITKSKVKSIAKKQADKRLKANVNGSHVNLADTATNADSLGGSPANTYQKKGLAPFVPISGVPQQLGSLRCDVLPAGLLG